MKPRFIEGIILFIIIKLGREILLAKEDVIFSGVKLEGNSSICRELPFKKLDEFSFCFFLKLHKKSDDVEITKKIVTLSDGDSIISLDLSYYSIKLSVNSNTVYYRNSFKKLKKFPWTRICLYREAKMSEVLLWINYREARKEFENAYSYSVSEEELTSGNASLCFQDDSNDANLEIGVSVAAVSISDHFSEDKNADNCIRTLKKEQTIEFSEEDCVANNVSRLNPNITELCFDTYVIPFINQSGNYFEQQQLCKLLNGRFLHIEEVEHFQDYLHSFESKMKLQANASQDYRRNNFWLSAEPEKLYSSEFCKVYLALDDYFDYPCSWNLKITFCITSSLGNFKIYGHLEKYDRYYFLIKKDQFSFYLKGEDHSQINGTNNKWVMSSSKHEEEIELESALPVGRQKWTSPINKTKNLLTITHCKEKEFACSDGNCLPWYVRCNGTVECSDESDEENCNQLEKAKGYLVDFPPRPDKSESTIKIYYKVNIVNIADISSKGKLIKMQIQINLTWYDPRITFWNIEKNELINRKNIWSPELRFVGNYHPGFLIEIDKKKTFISCRCDPHSFETNPTRSFTDKDPYIGTFISGKEVRILYTFESILKVPCSFNLRRYPFGKQSCNFAFMIQDVKYSSNSEFVYDGNVTDGSNLIYNGSRELGEYNFVSANHDIGKYGAVVVTIHLVNLYGFHMLNSFVPTFLICIIAYSTLIFPIKDFSDRVMLSLTTLLVLAALFTQSSNTSVITPYYKLLDIWYVVSIFYCFMIVIYNTLLRKFTSVEERKARNTLLNAKYLYEDCDFRKSETPNQWKKKLVFYNFVAIIIFSSFYILFLFFFCLAAVEII